MTTPHKWAAEIHAMADGKEVEGYFIISGDAYWRPATNEYNPLTNPNNLWRIVPEKKVLRYRVAKMRVADRYYTITVNNEKDANEVENLNAFSEWIHDWQEVEVE
jgi:hypothetical protein